MQSNTSFTTTTTQVNICRRCNKSCHCNERISNVYNIFPASMVKFMQMPQTTYLDEFEDNMRLGMVGSTCYLVDTSGRKRKRGDSDSVPNKRAKLNSNMEDNYMCYAVNTCRECTCDNIILSHYNTQRLTQRYTWRSLEDSMVCAACGHPHHAAGEFTMDKYRFMNYDPKCCSWLISTPDGDRYCQCRNFSSHPCDQPINDTVYSHNIKSIEVDTQVRRMHYASDLTVENTGASTTSTQIDLSCARCKPYDPISVYNCTIILKTGHFHHRKLTKEQIYKLWCSVAHNKIILKFMASAHNNIAIPALWCTDYIHPGPFYKPDPAIVGTKKDYTIASGSGVNKTNRNLEEFKQKIDHGVSVGAIYTF